MSKPLTITEAIAVLKAEYDSFITIDRNEPFGNSTARDTARGLLVAIAILETGDKWAVCQMPQLIDGALFRGKSVGK